MMMSVRVEWLLMISSQRWATSMLALSIKHRGMGTVHTPKNGHILQVEVKRVHAPQSC
jgi:hypothetical protein